MIPNVPYFPICYYGILRAGGDRGADERAATSGARSRFYLRDSGAKLLFAWHGVHRGGAAGARTRPAASASPSTPGEFEQLVGAAEPVVEIVDRAESTPR